ncbi:MAG: hydantoinase/oxoprolinase family protein, partial [Chloroflexi bacterium]|nr:hydantoinase/oxoprolinase family protein [Chloroflexota bacterium]
NESLRAWQVWVDTGGTFTDCLARDPDGHLHRAKVLSSSALRGAIDEVLDSTHLRVSEAWDAAPGLVSGFAFRFLTEQASDPSARVLGYDPASRILSLSEGVQASAGMAFELVSPDEAPLLAARLVTGTASGQALPPMEMRLATTRGTNALLERRGARVALFTTRGFGDLLVIGDQSRPDLFALDIRRPPPLAEAVVEVTERLAADGSELEPLDFAELDRTVQDLLGQGITAAAVALLHSYRNPAHEQALEEYLRRAGFHTVSTSSSLAPLIKILPRAQTAVVDAYLSPLLGDYCENVRRGLHEGDSTATRTLRRSLLLMTSAGSLVDDREFRAKDSLLSGPAGGVVGAFSAAERSGFARAIAFDMGGTSTDVARYDGAYDYTFEHRVGDAFLSAPALAIESVAAGGGSICRFERGTLQVGPQSAGAHPGPACYGAGGPLTLTDVHVLLGRLDHGRFPIPISPAAAADAFRPSKEEVEASAGVSVDADHLLEGFLDIANERMADAVRSVSIRQGCEPGDYCLVAFGGAGGQHACAVAARLGIRLVLAPADAGLLSAAGLGAARVERFAERQVLQPLEAIMETFPSLLHELEKEARAAVERQGISSDRVIIRRRIVHLRLMGQDSTVSIEHDDSTPLTEAFARRYTATFGHPPPDKPLELESA